MDSCREEEIKKAYILGLTTTIELIDRRKADWIKTCSHAFIHAANSIQLDIQKEIEKTCEGDV